MDDKNCTRRDFLLTFATLSSTSLLLSLSAGCGIGPDGGPNGGPMSSGPGPVAVYGAPAPTVQAAVSGIYYTDGQSFSLLASAQQVPAQTQFKIEFSVNMGTAIPTIFFTTSATNTDVTCIKTWLDRKTLSVTPAAPLAADTGYILRVGEAMDANGTKITITSNATATFHTATV